MVFLLGQLSKGLCTHHCARNLWLTQKKRRRSSRAEVPSRCLNANKFSTAGKHPVSALVELCNKRRWGAPQFTVINETGPDHKKNFLFKVSFLLSFFSLSVDSHLDRFWPFSRSIFPVKLFYSLHDH